MSLGENDSHQQLTERRRKMKYTSAQAAKLLRKLDEDISGLLTMEGMSKEFLASVGEDPETVRPEYDFNDTQGKLEKLEERVRTVKHAISCFNCSYVIEELGMTIDQALIYIPQLSRRKMKLEAMRNVLPKQRVSQGYGSSSNIIDYRYANYDIAKAEEEFDRVSELLSKAQNALDLANSTVEFDIKTEDWD